MVVFVSSTIDGTNSSKSRESDETPPPSEPQTNFPVVASQFKVSPAASQSPSNPPVVSGSLNEDIEAYPTTSKLDETHAAPPSEIVNTAVPLSCASKMLPVDVPLFTTRALDVL